MPLKSLYELIRLLDWKNLRVYKGLTQFKVNDKSYYGLSCSFKILQSYDWIEIEKLQTCSPVRLTHAKDEGNSTIVGETYIYWVLSDANISIVISEMHEKLFDSFYKYGKDQKKEVIELFNSTGSGKTTAMLYCIVRLLAKKEGFHLCNKNNTVTYYWYDEHERRLLFMKNEQAYVLTNKSNDEMALPKLIDTREILKNFINVAIDTDYKPISKFAFHEFANAKILSLTDLLILSNTYMFKNTVWFWPYQSKETIALIRCLFENYHKNDKLNLELNSTITSSYADKVSAVGLFEVCGPDLNLANTCANIQSYLWLIYAYLDMFEAVFDDESSLKFGNHLSVPDGIQMFLDELLLYETACQTQKHTEITNEKNRNQCFPTKINYKCGIFPDTICGASDFIKLPVFEHTEVFFR